MAGPLGKARHVTPRPRRRQGSSPLFRTVLFLALLLTSAVAIVEARSAMMLNGARGSAPVATRIPVAGVAAGACMSFAPATGATGARTVFIDPGHGGPDPGVVVAAGASPLLEKDVTLGVATRLVALLRTDGYRVVMSRVTDAPVASLGAIDTISGALTAAAVHKDLIARVACANAAGASVLLSIHFNAFDDPSVGGAETFFDTARPFAGQSRRLAGDIQSAVVAAIGAPDRGVWTDDQAVGPALTPAGSTYGHLIELGPAEQGWVDNPSRMAGALVEPLFLTDPVEARYVAQPAGQGRIAEALRTGLETYLEGS
jgi:N-acetylmuramoyl-L-alanine amidase